MKITGTLLRPASRLRRRQVSKPSMPGITASSSTISGVICSTMRIAEAPSIATITVMPAPSSASVRSRNVSGESSTTNATSRFFGSGVMRLQHSQSGHVLIEIEAVDQHAHLRDEGCMFGVACADFVELELDGADVAHLAEVDQLVHMAGRRRRAVIGPLRYWRGLVALVAPVDLEQPADHFQQPRQLDRLHQIAVMERLSERGAVRLQRARRNHQDARLMVAGGTQRLRNGPAVHAGHGDIQQEQIGPAVLGEAETAWPIRRAEQD